MRLSDLGRCYHRAPGGLRQLQPPDTEVSGAGAAPDFASLLRAALATFLPDDLRFFLPFPFAVGACCFLVWAVVTGEKEHDSGQRIRGTTDTLRAPASSKKANVGWFEMAFLTWPLV